MFLRSSQWSSAHGLVVGDGEDQATEGAGVGAEGGDVTEGVGMGREVKWISLQCFGYNWCTGVPSNLDRWSFKVYQEP